MGGFSRKGRRGTQRKCAVCVEWCRMVPCLQPQIRTYRSLMIMNKRNCLRAITLIVVVAIGAACCFIWKMQRTDDATSPDSWGKKVFVTSGVGIRSVCEPGMRISTILRRIGRYAKYHDSGDCYAKYEWGLDIFGVKGGVGARVDTMVFRVRPVEYGVANLPIFVTDQIFQMSFPCFAESWMRQ